MDRKVGSNPKPKVFSWLFLLCICSFTAILETGCAVQDTGENWRLAVSAWSFNKFTFFEAVDKTASLGLAYIEAYEGQRISNDMPQQLNHALPDKVLARIKKKLDSTGVQLINFYIHWPEDEEKCRKVFEFARKMGIETIVSEPNPQTFDINEKLCDEYGINLAVHNHPQGRSRYWHPKEVLKVCRGRSKRIGACGDVGHWQRSGIRPADAVKMLKGRNICFHVKDLNEFGNPKAHDVPWGTGKGELDAMFGVLNRQNFNGVFSIEYEYHSKDLVPQIRQCVEYFNRTANRLGHKER
ncbi:MAG: sugar phosphate isomerase/epimerase family protein [Planctomycetota bacterium]|jgi:sugar phosphate isomerase/epimerase